MHSGAAAIGVLLSFAATVAAAAPAGGSARSVALLGVTGGVGLDPRTVASLEELLLAALAEGRGWRVVGRSDIASLLGWEQKKQKLGCEESARCIAEVAGALGVDVIASADLGHFGSTWMLSLKLIDSKSATVLVRVRRKVASETELPDAVEPLVREALEKIAGPEPPARTASAAPAVVVKPSPAAQPVIVTPAPAVEGPPAIVAEAKSPARGGRSKVPLVVAASASLVAAAAGGFFGFGAQDAAARMQSGATWAARAQAEADARQAVLNANVSYGVAAAALVTGGVWWWIQGRNIERNEP